MFKDVAMTGLFPSHETAMRAGERLREVVGSRGLVRVLFPGGPSSVIEVSVQPSTGGTIGVMATGILLGVAGFLAVAVLGGGWLMASVALAWGAALGAMLAWWLTGTTQPLRTLRGADAKRCCEMLSGSPRAVVVVVGAVRHEQVMRDTIESDQGETFSGTNPWLTAATRAPPPAAEVLTSRAR